MTFDAKRTRITTGTYRNGFMTIDEAISILKIEITRCRKDFYTDRIKALEMAINALYEEKNANRTEERK